MLSWLARWALLAALLLALARSVLAWDAEDFEIFDLVSALELAEGKGTSFYSFLNVTPTATSADIGRMYRKRSLELHPDKNPHMKGAPERFARLGVIANILRSEEKRKRYHYFYENGVPKWKGTGYFYSRYRPGLGAALTFLALVTCMVQNLVHRLNYKSELKRIRRFQSVAKATAYGKGKPVQQTRKKVKVPIRDVGLAEAEGDEPAPARGGSRDMLSLIVQGDQVFIATEDGDEIPLDESAAVAPSWQRTWVPSLIASGINRARGPSKAIYMAPDESEEPEGSATSSARKIAPSKANKQGGRRRK
ncbi:uncharacterized protein L969DRAFT_100587 [Mixia osmundae IAM 14324]|uniref:J domain-containing protein n=1 Tax=Mixia osmundae (strain CBS 9802 / IAM 14324 / JCM 22182 / KY 12970) TaxID=764103 RepID=G7DVB0_MIXOS|nr:uncharacterized protein L969DRAFT_100587 [Mixia osmundae IAM 14324]KEI42057.1 hypothetical protein L969DRAFT_100587 [Mixia osmundae IAM 14324]GAA94520.1 hypothetical protein E5Q_01172 [Mixia osmundae IAM 14324]